MTENTIPTSEVLNRAADLIEERGWTKGTSGMLVGGPHCTLGAIAAATDSSLRPDLDIPTYDYLFAVEVPRVARDARDAVLSHLDVFAAPAGEDMAVYSWNDRATPEKVIEVLRAAAVIEAAKESAEIRESVTS